MCQHVFTEANLDTMAELANQKLAGILDGSAERRKQLEAKLAQAQKRRQRLLDLVESDNVHLNMATLGERLNAVTTEVASLRSDIEAERERERCARPVRLTKPVVQRYISDTGHLIRQAPQEQLKAWLRQAVERIRVEPTGDLVVHSRLPEDGLSLPYRGGGPCRTRTCDLGIKSPLLCQLS